MMSLWLVRSKETPSMLTPVLSHVYLDDQGVARIEGTRTKVIQVALDKIARGWDAEEIHAQYPDLSLGQIHSALAYYYDHREALDAEIERRDREVERLRAQAGRQYTRAELEERLTRESEAAKSG
jgi:uncharacterized protein (DUF433 family)